MVEDEDVNNDDNPHDRTEKEESIKKSGRPIVVFHIEIA